MAITGSNLSKRNFKNKKIAVLLQQDQIWPRENLKNKKIAVLLQLRQSKHSLIALNGQKPLHEYIFILNKAKNKTSLTAAESLNYLPEFQITFYIINKWI